MVMLTYAAASCANSIYVFTLSVNSNVFWSPSIFYNLNIVPRSSFLVSSIISLTFTHVSGMIPFDVMKLWFTCVNESPVIWFSFVVYWEIVDFIPYRPYYLSNCFHIFSAAKFLCYGLLFIWWMIESHNEWFIDWLSNMSHWASKLLLCHSLLLILCRLMLGN